MSNESALEARRHHLKVYEDAELAFRTAAADTAMRYGGVARLRGQIDMLEVITATPEGDSQ